MQVLAQFSNIIIPAILFYIVGYGLVSKVPVFESFLKGAEEGILTVFRVAPTLIGLLLATGVLRSSGVLDAVAELLGTLGNRLPLPKEIIPLALVKFVSGSAATGLLLDVFKTYGPDSYIGRMASIMMSSTETVLYTMSVYFMAAKVTKTRYTLWGAVTATLAGIAASVAIASLM